jgi:hypothetical protein
MTAPPLANFLRKCQTFRFDPILLPERSGKKPLEGKRVTVFELGTDSKIHDVWVRDEDQYAVDEFFS